MALRRWCRGGAINLIVGWCFLTQSLVGIQEAFLEEEAKMFEVENLWVFVFAKLKR
ncbi:hypothetical protein PCASD_26811 [Puccinia coronata f. sp. avenae]|uniref:Uncharacterized protein n=1 Tax=Puccinia coronata f. sp. avenae TaxID=200324 RepID=A0A2N5SK10_9BASI|nr:hypothetical protein PCASD_26811 [Puccinia coronata f. sp. avenae]